MKHLLVLPITALVLAGCASSATQVKVPTKSMEEAWKATSTDRGAEAAEGRLDGAVLRQEQPLPVVSAPDIRMAFIFPATDAEGNMHYGSWVALPIDTFKWIMPEGVKAPMRDRTMAPAVR